VLRDFTSFLAALWREWKVLLSGGGIIAVLSLWNLAGWKPIPHDINWLILGMTFVLAAFAAWRREWIDAGKGFVTVSPAELIKLYESGTSALGEVLVTPYIGKRMRVTGKVYDVQNNGFGSMSHVSLTGDQFFLALWIPSRKMEPFMLLPKGATITVAARISSVYASGIRMRDCGNSSAGR
jgi:hypothetical protein